MCVPVPQEAQLITTRSQLRAAEEELEGDSLGTHELERRLQASPVFFLGRGRYQQLQLESFHKFFTAILSATSANKVMCKHIAN